MSFDELIHDACFEHPNVKLILEKREKQILELKEKVDKLEAEATTVKEWKRWLHKQILEAINNGASQGSIIRSTLSICDE